MKKLRFCVPVFLGLLVFSLWGCAAPSIYTIDMNYDAAQAVVPIYLSPDQKALQSIIAVAEFSDLRQVDDALVIGRVIEKDGMKVLVLPRQKRPTEAVADGVRNYLRKAGYNVSGVLDRWNLSESTIPRVANSKILIGGAIEEIEITCRRAFPTNAYTTKIKMTICVADTASRKILHKSTVVATTSLEHMVFSEDRMGEQAAYALGDAIEKLFEKHELAQVVRQSPGN